MDERAASSSESAESWWPAAAAVVAVAGIRLAVPDSLSVGPRWLQVTLIAIVLAMTIATHQRHRARVNQILAYILAGVITFFLIWSVMRLVRAVPANVMGPVEMLRSAVTLWTTNVLVFAYWYWRIDGGGPHQREDAAGYHSRDLLFPQMTMPDEGRGWAPQFIDYLFVAFNTSTAFSPTDVPVLSPTAKVLSMLQASISLTVVIVLLARAVGIL